MIHVISIFYGVLCGMLAAGIAIVSNLMTPGVPALVKVFLRFFIGGIGLIPFLSYREYKKITKQDVLHFSLMGLFFVVLFNSLFFNALRYIDAITASLMLSAQPLVALIVSTVFFRHIPTKRMLLGFIITLSGVALVITKGQVSCGHFSGGIGELLMLAAVCFQVMYTLTLRHVGTRFSAPFTTFAVSLSGLLFLFPFTGSSENFAVIRTLSVIDWVCMGYIGIIGTTIAIVLYSLVVKDLGPALGSLIVFSTLPVATMIYSYFLGCPPSMIELIGSACVVIGLVLGLRGQKKPKETVPVVMPE